MTRTFRFPALLLLLALAAVLVWVLVDPAFRGKTYLAVPFGLSLVALALAYRKKTVAFGSWLSLAILGHTVALQMTAAGSSMRYQHFLGIKELASETHPLFLLIFLVQTVLIAAGVIRHRTRIRNGLKKHVKTWQLLVLGFVFFITSATVSAEYGRYLWELVFATFVRAVSLGNLLLVVLSFPEKCRTRLFAAYGARLREYASRASIDRYVVLAAVGATVLSASLAIFSYQRHPHIPDEVAYVLQSNFFASGRLTAPSPPVPEAFDIFLMKFDGGRWYSCMPPGWPAVLALGALIGMAWLVNPMLAGLNVILTYLLLRELYDPRLARLGALLTCLSPWFIFMGMSFMSHMLTLTCFLLAGLLVTKARQTGGIAWALLAGIVTGCVSLIRPLDAIIVGFLLGLWVIGMGGRRLRLPAIAAFGLGVAVAGGLVLSYNSYLTGHPLHYPVMLYMEERFGPGSNDLGFGPNRGAGWAIDPFPGHGPIDALVNANLNTFSVNVELFGWSLGSLLLLVFFLIRNRWKRSDWLMVAVVIAVFVPHFFYYFSGGPDFGARYWFLMFTPCVALSARGIQVLAGQFRNGQEGWSRAIIILGVLSISTLVNHVPWRAVDKYHHYLNMRPDLRELAQERGFGKSLVLIQGDEHTDYVSAAVYNPVILTDPVTVYAWDWKPETTERLLAAYTDRPIWIVEGPTKTNAGYKVIAGPLPPRAIHTRLRK